MKVATGKKIIVNDQQKAIAQAIFGPDLAAEILGEAKAKLAPLVELVETVKGLKAAVDDLSARLTAFELAKGFDIHLEKTYFKAAPTGPTLARKYYATNGKAKPEGLAPNYFPKEDS